MNRTRFPATLDVGILMSSLALMRGGMETQVRCLVEGLVARGHHVSVVTGRRPGHDLPVELAALPVRWLRVPCMPANLPAWRWLARRRPGWPLKAQSLSFVSSARLHPGVRALIAAADVTVTFFEVETVLFSTWRARRGRPNLSYFPGGIDWKWLRRDRSVVRVALSRSLAERYQGVAGFKVDGVVVPGVPEAWLASPYAVRNEARTLVFVGRLEANKGVMELVDIFAALAGEFPNLQLRILGDGPLRGAVEAGLVRDGLCDRVRCLGAVAQTQVWQELRGADLFVFPSHYESLPMAVLEAQAVGVPVVGSDIPGLREAVGETALLLPRAEPRRWVEAIRALIQDPAARARMSSAGRARARQFTWPRAVAEMERYMHLTLARRP